MVHREECERRAIEAAEKKSQLKEKLRFEF
jgi:hypothetical protein